MGLFSRAPKVPDTIADEQWNDLQDRAGEDARNDAFSRRNVDARHRLAEQHEKRDQS